MMKDAQEKIALVQRAQAGDSDAFDQLVRQFQDRAVGYAAARLGDWHQAEDAAQEAFIEAYRDLPGLRAPAAFASWLRRIVFKQCDRIFRRRQVQSVPMESAAQVAEAWADPVEALIQRDLRATVRQAIGALPLGEREVMLLFHMGDCSHREISDFLDIPITTVKSRLHSARCRLKERMMTMVQDSLWEERPSRDAAFIGRVNEQMVQALAEVASGDANEQAIRQAYPSARFRDPHPVYELTVSILRWARARDVSEIHLIPGEAGVSVLFRQEGAMREVMILPASLREPITARIKDGANLNVTEQHRPQEGVTPLDHQGKLLDMLVSCLPSEDGEKIVLRLVPKPIEAA